MTRVQDQGPGGSLYDVEAWCVAGLFDMVPDDPGYGALETSPKRQDSCTEIPTYPREHDPVTRVAGWRGDVPNGRLMGIHRKENRGRCHIKRLFWWQCPSSKAKPRQSAQYGGPQGYLLMVERSSAS